MQLIATLTQILPLQTGSGKNGTWKKQEIIVETDGQYPKKVCVALWGDKAETPLNIGQKLKIDFDVESREYNGKWYTDVKAWKVEATDGASQTPQTSSPQAATSQNLPTTDTDDLPF